MSTVKEEIHWLWNASKGIHSRIALCSVVGALNVCASLFFVWVCKQLIDIATRSSDGNMKQYMGLFIATVSIEIVLSAWKTRLESQNDIRLKNKMRYMLFSHLMLSTWNGKERFHSGDVVNRLEEDVRLVAETLCKVVPSAGVTCFQLIAAFIFLSHLNRELAWITVLIMPVFLLASKFYLKRIRRLTKEIRSTDSCVQSHIQEKLQHKVLIQTFGQSRIVAHKLESLQTGLYKQVMSRTSFTIFSRTLVMTGFSTGYVIAFIWGVNGIYEGVVSFGMMAAFLQLAAQIQGPVVEISQHASALSHAVASVDRLKELGDLPSEEQGEQQMPDGEVGIRLENVSFAYPDGDRQVINNFSFDFTPGSRTAIVGETGTGKSTLIRLMLALLQPQAGKICIYNQREEIKASPLTRCNLVYVPQGNTLLSGTIRDNLLLGNPEATEKQIEEVLHVAAAEFVYNLPERLDTLCGERGTGLSEGQAQRICIARGLLRPGRILLLDEFSSSLDKETERLLMERLTSQTKGKTLVFITHRETITEYCGQKIHLNNAATPHLLYQNAISASTGK